MRNTKTPATVPDKPAPSHSFQLFQPTQQMSMPFDIFKRRTELSEMLQKNSTGSESFKLQPSIINVEAVKDAEKRNISDFSTQLQPKTRGRKPNSQKSHKNIEKERPTADIKKFEPSNDTVDQPETVAEPDSYKNAEADLETEIRKQIKAHQFDSETEDIHDYYPLGFDFKADLCFIENDHLPLINKKITKGSKKLFDLMKFVKNRETETREVKTYACKYCPKVFVKRAALGGHTAKNHPQQSDSYRIRQESLKNRKIERERFDYFKAIEHK